MKKYIITGGASGSLFNASAKAPLDIETILIANGYTPIPIRYLEKHRGQRWFLIPILPIKNFFKIDRHSEIVFQYAPITCHKALMLIISILLSLLQLKKVTRFAIIHDLASMRENLISQRKERRFLNQFDGIIVHSEAMKEHLIKMGYQGTIRILGLFDYLVDVSNKETRHLSGSINFSGNLKKSAFLAKLQTVATQSFSFELFGKENADIATENIHYYGAFSSNNLSSLKGSWGLVWDGNSIDKLEGDYGVYQKINSPHKASMYICAELPLIVSEESAIASIVKKENLGILVKSIHDIPDVVETLEEKQYQEILSNVVKYSERLKKGVNTMTCMEELEKVFATDYKSNTSL